MRKKLLMWALLICCSGLTYAQLVTVTDRVELPLSTAAFYPVLNQDGSELLFTSENYYGLNLYQLDKRASRVISTDEGAGFKPCFEANDNKVYFQRTTRVNMRQSKELQSYDKDNNEVISLSDIELMPNVSDKTLPRRAATLANNATAAFTNSLKLYIERGGKVMQLDPMGDGTRYIWGSLSPDGSKVLFTATGKGTYTCKVDGSQLTKVGYLNAPVWYDDNLVVGMVDQDNGDYITSSSVVIKTIDGKQSQVLSSASEIAMHPCSSTESGKIAYNTIEGKIIVLNLKK